MVSMSPQSSFIQCESCWKALYIYIFSFHNHIKLIWKFWVELKLFSLLWSVLNTDQASNLIVSYSHTHSVSLSRRPSIHFLVHPLSEDGRPVSHLFLHFMSPRSDIFAQQCPPQNTHTHTQQNSSIGHSLVHWTFMFLITTALFSTS